MEAGQSTRKLRSWTTRYARKRMIGLSVSMRCAGPESWTKVVHLPGYLSRAMRSIVEGSSSMKLEKDFLLPETDVIACRDVRLKSESAQHPYAALARQRDHRIRIRYR